MEPSSCTDVVNEKDNPTERLLWDVMPGPPVLGQLTLLRLRLRGDVALEEITNPKGSPSFKIIVLCFDTCCRQTNSKSRKNRSLIWRSRSIASRTSGGRATDPAKTALRRADPAGRPPESSARPECKNQIKQDRKQKIDGGKDFRLSPFGPFFAVRHRTDASYGTDGRAGLLAGVDTRRARLQTGEAASPSVSRAAVSLFAATSPSSGRGQRQIYVSTVTLFRNSFATDQREKAAENEISRRTITSYKPVSASESTILVCRSRVLKGRDYCKFGIRCGSGFVPSAPTSTGRPRWDQSPTLSRSLIRRSAGSRVLEVRLQRPEIKRLREGISQQTGVVKRSSHTLPARCQGRRRLLVLPSRDIRSRVRRRGRWRSRSSLAPLPS
ncbi:hypothetical protein EVAR_61634_1 [Eumeta japonica]|uniref:Uncharacterized protein n=1 Tax=Eumeta variegata TaxID=151549 RepID=A0A4C1Z7P3_EUMVA|nr:hypothetical protein EVAR_61634_1 [Eumeta japonica]